MNFKPIIILILLLSITVQAAEQPKDRTVIIKKITSDVINIQYGRSVKLVFPWAVDGDNEELPHHIDIADTSVFDFDYKDGQNFIRVSYNNKGEFAGEIADLHINSHGYHFTIALHSVASGGAHHSLVNYTLSDNERIYYRDRETKKIEAIYNKKFQDKLKEVDRIAENKALLKIGELAISEGEEKSIYQQAEITTDNDEATFYIDKSIRHGDIVTIPFEISNDFEKDLKINSVKLIQSEGGTTYAISHKVKNPKKITPEKSSKGFIVTNDINFSSIRESSVIFNTNYGKAEVKF